MTRHSTGATPFLAGRLAWMALWLGLPQLAVAATIVVPTDQPSIQAAVTAAAAGDTVLVGPGTYREHVRIGDGRHGLTLAAADEDAPPTLLGDDGASEPGIFVDRTDDVVVRNLVLRGAAEGVRIERAYGVVLSDLRIENSGLGVRLRRGGRHQILSSQIVGTRTAQGIRVEASPEVLIRDVTVDGTRRDGILVLRSRGARIAETTVSNTRARHGILVTHSPHTELIGCTARRNQRDGIRVRASTDLELRRNDADDNGSVGVHLDRCSPFPSVGDVVAAGNQASANARRDVVVTRPDCRRNRCRTTTTQAPGSPSTTVTTTTTARATTSTPTTTAVTPTSQPLPLTTWRLYVRIAQVGHAPHDVNVPLRSADPALVVDVAPRIRAAFRVGDQVAAAEIVALGGDTLGRFQNAAIAYIAAHPADYPEFAGFDAVHWVMRVSGPE